MNRTIGLLLLLLGAVAAHGSAPRDASSCFDIDDDAKRLNCYDTVLGRNKAPSAPTTAPASAAKAAPPATAAPAAVVAPAAAAAATSGAPTPVAPDASFGMNSKLRREQQGEQAAPGETKELAARVTQVKRSPEGFYTVWLDNGQVWRQIEIVRDLSFAAGDSVTIRRTFSGSYLLRNNVGNRAGYARRLE